MIYEILIRGTADGKISGSHVIDFIVDQPGVARVIGPGDWPSIAKEINASAIATVAVRDAEIAKLKAALSTKHAEKEEQLTAELERVTSLLAAKEKELTDEKTKDKRQKQQEAIDAQIAELQKAKAEL